MDNYFPAILTVGMILQNHLRELFRWSEDVIAQKRKSFNKKYKVK